MVEIISAGAQLPAILAGVHQAPRKVNVLHVFPEIPTAVLDHAAEQALEAVPLRTALNIGVQILLAIYNSKTAQ